MPDTAASITGWIFSGILTFVGGVGAATGWYVRGKQAEYLAVKKDLHEAIDKTIKALSDFEDCAISFWGDKDTKHIHAHILVLHRRLVIAYKQVAEFRSAAIPTHILAELRKTATLDFETAKRPIPGNDARMMRIMSSITQALDSPFLLKSWNHDESITLKDRLLGKFQK